MNAGGRSRSSFVVTTMSNWLIGSCCDAAARRVGRVTSSPVSVTRKLDEARNRRPFGTSGSALSISSMSTTAPLGRCALIAASGSIAPSCLAVAGENAHHRRRARCSSASRDPWRRMARPAHLPGDAPCRSATAGPALGWLPWSCARSSDVRRRARDMARGRTSRTGIATQQQRSPGRQRRRDRELQRPLGTVYTPVAAVGGVHLRVAQGLQRVRLDFPSRTLSRSPADVTRSPPGCRTRSARR